MAEPDPKTLNPISFLQAFIVQSIRVAEQGCPEDADSLDHVAKVGLAASGCLEEVARHHLGITGPLNTDQYAAAIIDIKNRIGGCFERVPGEVGSIRVINHRCPFGDLVKEASELCRMTSSLFGAIAARNFGYAKVELHKRIATRDGHCDVRIHLDPEVAARHSGDEYRSEGNAVTALSTRSTVASRLEEKLCQAWCPPTEEKPLPLKPRRIVAESVAMQAALRAVEVVAPTPASVLITGETGVARRSSLGPCMP